MKMNRCLIVSIVGHLTLFGRLVSGSGVKCPNQPFPRYGSLDMPCRTWKCTLTYSCREGYWYTGTTTRVCQSNGQWSGQAGECQEVWCSKLTDPTNGHIEYRPDRSYLAEAEVLCDEGFLTNGNKTQQCLGDNTWSGTELACRAVQCPSLPNPPHGKIDQSDRSYLSNATVVCELGYTHSSPDTVRQCLGNETWSGDTTQCEAVKCGNVSHRENGRLSAKGGQFKYSVILSCNSGHILDGHSKTTCTATGSWSPNLGYCRKPAYDISPIILGIVFAVVALLLCVFGLYYIIRYLRKRPGNVATDPEAIPLVKNLKKANFHCSFNIEGNFPDKDSKEFSDLWESITEGVRNAINMNMKHKHKHKHESHEHVGKDSDINPLFLCPKKRKAFLDINLKRGQATEDKIKDAIGKASIDYDTSYKIIKHTIDFKEKAIHRILMDVHRRGHIDYTGLDKPLDFEQNYVKLKLLQPTRYRVMEEGLSDLPDHHIHKRNEETLNLDEDGPDGEVQLEDLIKREEVGKYILIRGRAGFGKSTLLQWLLWKWANGDWATKFKVIFMLNLRCFTENDREIDLKLSKLLSLYAVYNTGDPKVIVDRDWLLNNEEQIGIILDGVDGIHSFTDLWQRDRQCSKDLKGRAKPLDWCFAMMKRQCLPKSTLIVSSCPFKDLDVAVDKFKESNNFLLVELLALTRDQVTYFVRKNAPDSNEKDLKQALDTSPVLQSVSAIPFFCGALCQVLNRERTSTLVSTYTQITAYVMQRYIQWSVQDETSVGDALRELSRIAYQGIAGEKYEFKGPPKRTFSKNDIENHINNDILNNMRHTGLVVEKKIENPQHGTDPLVLWKFRHLWFQELLAMAYLLTCHPDEVEKAYAGLFMSRYYSLPILFIYGMAFNRDSAAVKYITDKVDKTTDLGSETKKGLERAAYELRHTLPALRIAFECQSPSFVREMASQMFQKEICINGKKMTIVDVKALVYMLEKTPAIETIRLVYVDLDPDSLRELSTFLQKKKGIKRVEIEDNFIDDKAIEQDLCRSVSACPTMQKLLFISHNMTYRGLDLLCSAAAKNVKLKSLTFGGDEITDEEVAKLVEQLDSIDQLEEIGLDFACMADNSMENIATLLMSKVKKIRLRMPSRNISDAGVKYLADALQENATIEELRIISYAGDDKDQRYLDVEMTAVGIKTMIEALKTNVSVEVRIATTRKLTPE